MKIRKLTTLLLLLITLPSCVGNISTPTREVIFFGRLAYTEYDIRSEKPIEENDSRKRISGDIEICLHFKKSYQIKCHKFDSKIVNGKNKDNPEVKGKNFFYFKELLQDVSLKSISLNNGEDKYEFKHDAAKVKNITTRDSMIYLGDILLNIDTNYHDKADYNKRFKDKMSYEEYMKRSDTGWTRVGLLTGCNDKMAKTIKSQKGINVHNECLKTGVGVGKGENARTYFMEIPRVE